MSPERHLLDTSALLTLIEDEAGAERVEQVLFGAVDEYCDVLGYCYNRFFDRGNETIMTPLVYHRQSAIPGEGAV